MNNENGSCRMQQKKYMFSNQFFDYCIYGIKKRTHRE